MTDDRIMVSRKAVMDAWFEAEEAIIAETEARKEYLGQDKGGLI